MILFFFQAEDGIRDLTVTGVQTCALPILNWGKFDISFLLRASVGQDVFNTALVWSTKSNALQVKNFLAPALTDGTDLHEPAIYSSRWVESADRKSVV